MNVLQFIAEMTRALAWPAVVITLLILLRPHLGTLISRLTKLVLPGGAEAEFGEVLAEIKQDVKKTRPKTTSAFTTDAAPDFREIKRKSDAFKELSFAFPASAVVALIGRFCGHSRTWAKNLGWRRSGPIL